MRNHRLLRTLDLARLDGALARRAVAAGQRPLAAFRAGHAAFCGAGGLEALREGAQRLVDTLCNGFVLARKRVVLHDAPRPHRRRAGRIVYELHGRCRRDGDIEIFARTAAHERPVAAKTLLETLLHEFVHHHDFDAFGASVHCRGFYERLSQLYRPLKLGLEG